MSTKARFTGEAGKDNTSRREFSDYQAPAFASTLAIVIKPQAARTIIQPATLTGALTFTINVGTSTTPPHVGDTVQFLLTPDGTSRVATFGTGFLPTGTLSVTTAKFGQISFMFNGASWIEVARAISA